MAELIERPSRIPVPGGKVIDEEGWMEPAQRPDFDEVTLVLSGCVRVEHDGGVLDVRGGQAVITRAGERVRYTTPEQGGAEYVAICVPAFSPEAAHRDAE